MRRFFHSLDGSDAETGTGVNVGGRFSFVNAACGLKLDLEMRRLITQEAKSFRDWGEAASVTWDRQPITDHGLSLSFSHGWGALPSNMLDSSA